MGNLSNLYVSKSFQSLIHLGTDNVATSSLTTLQDGYGNSIGIEVNTAGDLFLSGSLTASLQQGYVWVGNASGKTTTVSTSSFGGSLPSGVVSGSSQIILQQTTGNLSGSRIDGLVLSSSFAISSSHSELADLATLATNATYAQSTIVTGKNLHSTTIAKGTPLYFTGSGTSGNLVGVYPADAGNPLRMPAGGVAGESLAVGAEGIVLLDGFISGVNTSTFASGDEVFVAVGGGYTNVAPTGSALIQHLGNVEKSAVNGSGVIQMMGEVRGLPNIQQGYAWVGDANSVPQAVATSSFGGGGTINTASFATTGSNTFVGDQIVVGDIRISGSTDNHLYINRPGGSDILRLGVSNNGNTFDFHITGSADQQLWLIDNQGGTWGNAFFGFIQAEGKTTINAPFTASQGAQINGGDLRVAGNLTASLQQGYVWVGNASGVSTTVATSSFGGGGTIDTGSFATTGSNTFTGDQTLIDAAGNTVTLSDVSGSLMLVAKTFTSASTHFTASAGNQVNLIFKNNNNTADTIISGSNNLFVNPATPTTGFKRYIGGFGNIILNPSNIPLISGSMGFSPTMNNNYIAGIGATITIRGPVSSSAYNINGNQIVGAVNIGTGPTTNAEKLTGGLGLSLNSIAGTLNIIANQSALTGSQTFFANNILNGIATLTLSSSAANLQNNNINDTAFNLINQYFSGSAGVGSVALNRNNIGGQSNSIIITGAQQAGTTVLNSISDNIMFGANNTLFIDVANSRVSGSSVYQNAIRNAIIGNNLIVTGSNFLNDPSSAGSVFVGRYNANDAIRNKTSDIIFAVGTGNTTTTKTGFLIDSGSNTFVEGTLNVSGSTTITGSVGISSVLQLASLDPLPAGAEGQLANSGSNLFFFSGSAWNRIAFA